MNRKWIEYIIIKKSGLFDANYYLRLYKDVRLADVDPLMHFITAGWKEGRNPSQLFETNYYLETNPDVQAASINPLVHYLRYGKKEGRFLGPQGERQNLILLQKSVHSQDDLSVPKRYTHYLRRGLTVGKKKGFKQASPRTKKKLDKTNIVDLVLDEAKNTQFTSPEQTISPEQVTSPEYLTLKNSDLFDPTYYLLNYPDVRNAGIDPLSHFIEYGWREGRNPSRKFDTKYYLETNPDVNKAGINPLFHYLKYGRIEGRPTQFNPKINALMAQVAEQDTAFNGNSLKLTEGNIRNIEFVDYQNMITIKPEHSLLFNEDLLINIDKLPTSEKIDIIICIGPNPENFFSCLNSIESNTKQGSYRLHLVVHEDDVKSLSGMNQSSVYIYTHRMELFNYSKANNLALRNCSGDVVLLNDDTEVTEGWLEKLKEDSRGVALTGAHTGFQRSGNPQMWGKGPSRVTNYPINMFCAYIPSRLRSVVGLLDEEFCYYGGEDVDYSCRSLLNGFPLVISSAFIIHKDNQSFKSNKDLLIGESNKVILDKYGITSPFDFTELLPKVSIIIATRNRPKLLKSAVESILRIDYQNFEIIIVDDNSDDETNRMIFTLQEKDKRIISIRMPTNVGSSSARDIGIKASKGQFIMFTDDDDTVLPNRVSKPLEYLIQHPGLDVVYCNYNLITDQGTIIPIYGMPFDFNSYLQLDFNIGCGILLGRRNTFIDVPFMKTYDRATDYDWVFRMLRRGYKLDLCPEIVMNYNRTGLVHNHLSGNNESINIHKVVKNREILLKSIEKKCS